MKRTKKIKPKQMLRMLLDEAMSTAPRISPECTHFGECGGCEFQDIEYSFQAEAKRDVLIKLIHERKLSNKITSSNIDLVTSPKPLGYRQRMDYVYAFNKAGLRKRNSHKWVIDLEECPLLGNLPFKAFQRAKELAEEKELQSYNYLSHIGFLRYFVIRRTRLGEVLLSIVTKSSENEEAVNDIAETIINEGLATSVHWLLQESMSDVSFGESIKYWGEEYIRENYLGKIFYIAPNTFFQANPDVAEKAYTKIKEHVISSKPDLVIDTYSGTGIIAQLIAENVKEVIAVENVKENLKIAAANLSNNKINNVELIEDDAFKYLASFDKSPEHIVVNPPRVGLDEKACNEICRIAPEVISYMSCNPLTLLKDLEILLSMYSIEECTVYDMFPQTKHWETLVLLKKIKKE